jgi:hypothetical protein
MRTGPKCLRLKPALIALGGLTLVSVASTAFAYTSAVGSGEAAGRMVLQETGGQESNSSAATTTASHGATVDPESQSTTAVTSVEPTSGSAPGPGAAESSNSSPETGGPGRSTSPATLRGGVIGPMELPQALDVRDLCSEWSSKVGSVEISVQATLDVVTGQNETASLSAMPAQGACPATASSHEISLGLVRLAEPLTSDHAVFAPSRLAVSDDGKAITVALGPGVSALPTTTADTSAVSSSVESSPSSITPPPSAGSPSSTASPTGASDSVPMTSGSESSPRPEPDVAPSTSRP